MSSPSSAPRPARLRLKLRLKFSQLHSAAVSKVCAICGKKPSFGHNRSHSMVATKRRFNPNLQRVRVLLGGKATRAYVCTRCLKSGRVEKAI
jgi:large subunit ribosomal protein L28